MTFALWRRRSEGVPRLLDDDNAGYRGTGALRCFGQLLMTCGGKDSEHVIIADRQAATCRFCGGAIHWGKTNAGKNAPADPDTGRNHWVTCRKAGRAHKPSSLMEKML